MEYSAATDSRAPFRNQVRRNIRFLSRMQEYELFVRYKESGDIEAGHKLVRPHKPVLEDLCRRFGDVICRPSVYRA